ncbi:MAG: haloacid dehalogenase type II [Anaerolineales bacterium]|nr:haloacid dehalogenase type II [Anaerolineales bacterium]
MNLTLAFDVYGTLIDPHGVQTALRETLPAELGEADIRAFSRIWRETQLAYSFRRGLMRDYVDFATCTRQALLFASAKLGVELSVVETEHLLTAYKTLPAFADTAVGLTQAKEAGHDLYALSNGSHEALEQLLTQAELRHFFTDLVSADEIKTFKPNPDIYHHFMRRAQSAPSHTWLISSNAFDVLGALNVGVQAVWVKRDDTAVFDPWDIPPTATIHALDQLSDALLNGD